MSLEAMVGRQLIVGLPGPDATDDDLRLLRDIHAGGLMLYRRNFETPERFLRFIARLEEGLGRRLLITTDHEGGRIIMLNRGVTIFPDNLTAGTAGDEAMVARQGLIEGRELRRLGVDVNFGPCLDVLTERYSPNIGIRSYGKDPALVSRLGAARIRGMQAGGISACAKHFPGKGHAPVDAHLGLPVIDSDWGDMHALHLPPFMAAMEAGVDCIMTSHPLYPNLDPAPAMPATFSKLIVEDYLRGQVGYRGVIVSDDLEMGAIGALCPIGEATVRTAAAGHDLLLVCHTAPAQRAAYEAVVAAYRDKTLRIRELEKSMARLDALDARRPERVTGGAPRAEADGEPLARAMAARAVTVVAAPDAGVAARAQRQGPRHLPAPVVTGRPHHDRAGHAGRAALPARGDGAARRAARAAGGGRGADRRGDRARAERGRRRGRHRAVPLRRAPLQVEPGAAGGGAGGRAEAGRGADARSVGRGVPRARRRRAHRLRVAALPARRGDGAPADVASPAALTRRCAGAAPGVRRHPQCEPGVRVFRAKSA